MLDQVIKNLLGNIDPAMYIACVIMAYAGFLLRLFYTVMTRNPTSALTPIHYSPKVFWNENGLRMSFSALLLPVVLIFSNNFLGGVLNTFVAFGAGLGSDMIAKKVFSPESQRNNNS